MQYLRIALDVITAWGGSFCGTKQFELGSLAIVFEHTVQVG